MMKTSLKITNEIFDDTAVLKINNDYLNDNIVSATHISFYSKVNFYTYILFTQNFCFSFVV